jgi:hypothetical protein
VLGLSINGRGVRLGALPLLRFMGALPDDVYLRVLADGRLGLAVVFCPAQPLPAEITTLPTSKGASLKKETSMVSGQPYQHDAGPVRLSGLGLLLLYIADNAGKPGVNPRGVFFVSRGEGADFRDG